MVGFGNWEFSPIDLENPFPNNEGSVHLWQGDDDRIVAIPLQRFIAKNTSMDSIPRVTRCWTLFRIF